MQRLRTLLVFALLVSLAAIAGAQLQSGNLYGTTKDDKGAALPGVTVTLSGQGAPQVQVSDADGAVRFLGLSPGSYALKAELQGFSTVDYPNVVIGVGRNTSIELALSGAVEDVITVTAESPLLDEKAIRTGNTVSQTELARIPTARDPWAVLQSTPGVLSDRINVGGNESGQQSGFIGPGSGGDQAVWSLDGMVITDMSATGSTPGYFDFDSFEELQVTTGGSDVTIATGGVTLNMVTKRGTNQWRGSGRYFFTDDSLQSDLSFDRGELAKPGPWRTGAGATNGQAAFKQGNRITRIEDYGAELGGPIVKDRLWIWGAYAKPDIRLVTISDFPDKTTLEDTNLKLNWQIVPSNSFTGFYWNSDKVKIGRNAGPTRPPETTWDQGKFGPSPTAWKVEDTHIFSSNFYLTGLYSKVNGGFQLVPEGGDKGWYLDATGTSHNSYLIQQILRPQEQVKLDASEFFSTGSVAHELKFGAAHRLADQTTLLSWPGGFQDFDPVWYGTSDDTIALVRDGFAGAKAKYDSAYLQDTLTFGQLTANVGLRYDKQGGRNAAKTVAANRFRPDLLPAINYPGGPAGFEWKSTLPRLGLTYALGADRKTLLRASYARFADQLATGYITQLNPVAALSYAYFYDVVSNHNGSLPSGCCAGAADAFNGVVNPLTGQLVQSNQVGRLDAPVTDELLLSVEHAVLPEFVVGLNLTVRKYTDAIQADLLVFDGNANSPANLLSTGRRSTRADYVVTRTLTGVLPNGQSYSMPVYGLRSGVTTRGGTVIHNGDAEQDYKSASLVFTKRLSNRWMLRGNFTYSDWTWNTPSDAFPNPTVSSIPNNGTSNLAGDGQIVLQGGGTGSGAKQDVWINSKWAYSVNALYQIAPDRPWGFNVAGNLTGRQGYPMLYQRSIGNPFGLGTTYQVLTKSDAFRLSDVHQLDLRIEKDFRFDDFGLTLGVDCFNVMNRATVLQRRGLLAQSTGDNVSEIVSPRLLRLGAKFSFR